MNQGAAERRMERAEMRRKVVMWGVEREARMKDMQAVLSMALVRAGPPLPPAPAIIPFVSSSSSYFIFLTSSGERERERREGGIPADHTTQSGFTRSRIFAASLSDLMSARSSTRTSSFPGWAAPRERMAGSWEGLRMREVRDQERERSLGVRRREMAPWPPMRRMCGMVDLVVGECLGV